MTAIGKDFRELVASDMNTSDMEWSAICEKPVDRVTAMGWVSNQAARESTLGALGVDLLAHKLQSTRRKAGLSDTYAHARSKMEASGLREAEAFLTALLLWDRVTVQERCRQRKYKRDSASIRDGCLQREFKRLNVPIAARVTIYEWVHDLCSGCNGAGQLKREDGAVIVTCPQCGGSTKQRQIQ